MASRTDLAAVDDIAAKIHTVRGVRVMLDTHLAQLYGVETRVLNQTIKRNGARFPGDFMFRLGAEESRNLRSQIVISRLGWGGRRYRPLAFTEHQAVMAATVLSSPRAVQMSIFPVRALLRLRQFPSRAALQDLVSQQVSPIVRRRRAGMISAVRAHDAAAQSYDLPSRTH